MANKKNNVNANQSNNNGTKIVCPHCGGAIWLPNHEREVSGIAIGRDSNLGTVVLRPDGPIVSPTPSSAPSSPGFENAAHTSTNTQAAESRLDILKRMGVDISNYVSLIDKNGEEHIAKKSGRTFVELAGCELREVEDVIRKAGYIANRRLWRRWIMAQMFHALRGGDFTGEIRRKGYMYQFRVLAEELRTLSILWKRDAECYNERKVFFTKNVVLDFANDHLKKVTKYCENLRVRKCKGVPYVKVHGKNIFVKDLKKVVYQPIREAIKAMEMSTNPGGLYCSFLMLEKAAVKLPWETTFSPAWMDAFKGAGSYYTLKNLILFHNFKLRGDRGRFFSTTDSMELLKAKVKDYDGAFWRLLALLKAAIAYNKYDFEADMKARGYRK